MKMSDSIAELATALAKAQGMIDDATKTGLNPAFRSKYADLAAVRAVIREPLAVNDLSIVQFPRTVEGAVEVETMMIHKSGEFMAETLRIPVAKWDAQGIGSGITYARRYGLMSMLSIASEDDDGNAAVQRPATSYPSQAQNKTDSKLLATIRAAAKEGSEALRVAWAGMTADERSSLGSAEIKDLKATAAAADEQNSQTA